MFHFVGHTSEHHVMNDAKPQPGVHVFARKYVFNVCVFKSAFVGHTHLIAFEYILKVIAQLLSEKVRRFCYVCIYT